MNSTLSKLLALNLLLTGCAARQSVVHYNTYPVRDEDGKTKMIQIAEGSYEMEYTPLGVGFNTATVGIYGMAEGACYQAKKAFNSTTNGVPVLTPSWNGACGFVSGAKEGLIAGCSYGYNMKYSEQRSFERVFKEELDQRLEYIKNAVSDPYQR